MKRNFTGSVGALAAGTAIWLAASTANASDALLNKLVEKGVLTQREANDVREELGGEQAATVEMFNKSKFPSWIDEVTWSGDLRLRAEYFDNEDQTATGDRWRYRFRLRFGLEYKFQDWAKVGVRFASGGDDPVSTNQSLQDTFSRKPINIDLAYVTLQPPGWDWVAVSAGKIYNPFWQPGFSSPLQYDGDVSPEGVAEVFIVKFGEKDRFSMFANFGQFVLDEAGGDANDPFMFEFQGGMGALFGEDPAKPVVKATGAAGLMLTHNLDTVGVASGSQPAGAASPGAQSSSPNRGNATAQPGGAVAPGNTLFYLDDFEVVYGRGELEWEVCPRPFLGTPAVFTFTGEYLMNLARAYDSLSGSTQTIDPDQTAGYSGQIKFGKAKKAKTWEIAYQYKYVEADATWDAITDSDWGLGGTDRKGHVISGAYQIRDWWQVAVKTFITQKISDRPNSGQTTRGNGMDDLLRVQVDSSFKF